MGLFQTVFQYVRLVWIYFLHAAFLSLLLARVLADKDWGWFYVFAPMFVWDCLALIYWVLYLISYVAKRVNDFDDEDVDDEWITFCFPKQSISLITLLSYAGCLPLKVAGEILLCLHLSDSDSVPFYIPGIVLCLLFTVVGSVLMFYALKPPFRLLQRHC